MTIREAIETMKQHDDAFFRMAANILDQASHAEDFETDDLDEEVTESEIQEEFSNLKIELKSLRNSVLLGALEHISGVEVWNQFDN